MKKILIILYGTASLATTIFSYMFIDKNLGYLEKIYLGISSENRDFVTILYTGIVIIFFALYFILLRNLSRRKIEVSFIWKILVVVSVLLLFSYPAMLSYDIFNYLTTAKVVFYYQENPYIVMPIEFIGDPYLSFTRAANKIALYGPSWILLTSIPYLLGFGNFLLILFNFKILITIFYLLTSLVIWKITKNILSLAFFSLNPLVIIETLISGHNDIVMIFFVTLAYYMILKRKIFIGIILFALSIFIKYTTILLAPIFIYMIWTLIQNKKINWENIFYFSAILMIIAFLLSPIREEIYPWYAIWFLIFVSFIPSKKIILYLSIALTFGLSLSYTSYMYSGSYSGINLLLKHLIIFSPILFLGFYFIMKKLWPKIYFRS